MTACGIYAIRNGDRAYIGHSVNISTRWGQHRSALRNGRHRNPHLQNAWNKHGEDAFEFVILEECAVGVLLEREQHYMDAHPVRYNIAPVAGSSLGVIRSDETRKRMSEAQKGKTHTPETREKLRRANMGNTNAAGHVPSHEARVKMGAASVGRKASPETRAKLSEALKGYVASPEARSKLSAALTGNKNRLGHRHTPEARAKMSETWRAYWAVRNPDREAITDA